jgi:HD-like signal output (HDOD) protein
MSGVSPSNKGQGFSPDDLVRQLRTLPPMPKVLMRLQPMLADVNTEVSELASVIRLERALAARVLQVCNSAYYGMGERTRSIEEAVMMIGFREVRRLVSLVLGMQIMEKPLPAYGIDARTLWRQSIACGLAAELLAPSIGEDPSAAYALGLLHSVGMVVVNSWAVNVVKSGTLANGGWPDEFCAAERALLGFTHAEAGASLLRRWEFPDSVVEPVKAQFDPLLASTHGPLAHLLYVARWLRTAACEGAAPALKPEARSLAALGLDDGRLQELLPQVQQRLQEADRLLDVKV